MNSAKKLFYITVRIPRDNIEIYINSVLKFWSNSILKVYSDRKETLHCDGACALKREQFAFYLQSGHSSSALHLGPSLFCRTRLRLSCMQKFCIYNKPQINGITDRRNTTLGGERLKAKKPRKRIHLTVTPERQRGGWTMQIF